VDGVVLDAVVVSVPACVHEDFKGAVCGIDACGAEFDAAAGGGSRRLLLVPFLRCCVVDVHCAEEVAGRASPAIHGYVNALGIEPWYVLQRNFVDTAEVRRSGGRRAMVSEISQCHVRFHHS